MRIPSFFTRKHKIKKKWVSEDDPQAAQVYLMERYFMGQSYGVDQPRELLESVAGHAARKWKVDVPTLDFEPSPFYGVTYMDRIVLREHAEDPGTNLLTLVHELAHWIVDRKYPAKSESHGPEFVYVYGKLLDQYKLLPESAYKVLCKEYGIKTLKPKAQKRGQ